MAWVDCSGMASIIKGELYCHSVTTSMTSPGATVSVYTSQSLTHSHTHSLYFRNSQTALSSTCLQCYLPQSLPGSQIPTVSAHVNSKITGHAHTHICFAFKRVISVCTQAIRSFSPLLFFFFFWGQTQKTKQVRFKDETEKRTRREETCRDDGHTLVVCFCIMTRGNSCFSAPFLQSVWTSPQWSQTTSPTEAKVSQLCSPT